MALIFNFGFLKCSCVASYGCVIPGVLHYSRVNLQLLNISTRTLQYMSSSDNIYAWLVSPLMWTHPLKFITAIYELFVQMHHAAFEYGMTQLGISQYLRNTSHLKLSHFGAFLCSAVHFDSWIINKNCVASQSNNLEFERLVRCTQRAKLNHESRYRMLASLLTKRTLV